MVDPIDKIDSDGVVVRDRMVTFAVATIQNRSSVPGAATWANAKELAATTPDVWEMSSRPR